MKYKNILLFFLIALPSTVVMRMAQLFFTTDELGLTRNSDNYELIVYVLWLLIVLAAIGCGVMGFLTHRCPEHAPKPNIWLLGASAAMAAACVFHAFDTKTDITLIQMLLPVFGILSGIVFLLYTLQGVFEKFKTPGILFVLPILYGIVLLIADFVKNNKELPSVTRVLELVVHCAWLLFLLEMGKQFNDIDKNRNFKKLLAAGLFGSCAGAIYSVPTLLAALFKPAVVHTFNLNDTLFFLFATAYMIAFTLNHFAEKNLEKPKRQRHRHHRSGPGRNSGDLYTG